MTNNDELFETIDKAVADGDIEKVQMLIEQAKLEYYPYGLSELWEPNPLLDWSKDD